jgi:dipeptidyl aminopeptidase/acylaminoacyl peptidase
MFAHTHRIPLVLLAALAACTRGDTAVQDAGAVEEPFTPASYTVEQLYENVQYSGAAWSPDGKKLLVNSNASGIYNAYEIPLTGGEPRPLTTSNINSIFGVSYFPADERILYMSDDGGNELTHVFVRDPDGMVQDLTPGLNVKASFAGWADDDRSFFVTSNERDRRYFDVYEYATDGYGRSMFYRNDEGFELGAISRDKRYVALVKPRTTSDADIYLHDRQTNTTKNITPHTGTANNSPAEFTPDGSALLFLSDSGREYMSLRRYDLATGKTATVYEQDWDVVGAEYSEEGKYLVVYVNEDSRLSARVLDAATMEPVPLPKMPDGLVRGISISPDETAFAFYSTDGSVPNDLYAGTFADSVWRLTNALNPAIRASDLVKPKVVKFASYDGLEIPGVLYKPHQASPNAKAPALVMVHGGPGGQAQVGYRALVQALVNRGYVVFDINNRGSSGYGKTFYGMDDRKHGEADLGDVVASKRMLIETGYVDSTKIGIIGGSYGGYMVLAALTLQPDEFAVGVDLFGISNWVRTLTSIPPWWASFRDALFQEMGDPETDSARLHRISPIFHADRIKAPLMVLQGANDPRVLQVESDEIVAAARANGVPVEYIVFPDEGHGFRKKENEIRGYTAVIAFLDRYLKGEGEATVASR